MDKTTQLNVPLLSKSTTYRDTFFEKTDDENDEDKSTMITGTGEEKNLAQINFTKMY